MKDLISREAVLNLVLPWCADDDGSVGKMGDLREVLDDIENLPSVELEEQKKAAALEALEDVRAEIEAMYGVTDYCDGSIRVDKYEVLASIEQKIKEIKHESI